MPPVRTCSPPRLDALGERRRVVDHRARVLGERRGRGDREAHRLRRGHVTERSSLQTGEHGAVDALREIGAAEHEARARSGERLVRRRGDDVGRLDRVLVQARSDETREVGHVDHQQRADLVGDLAEGAGIDLARVGRAAGDDQLRAVLVREAPQVVHVDALVLAAHAVADEVVVATREVDPEAVREMAAVVESQPQHRVALFEHRVVRGHVGRGAGVRLDVRMLGAEQRLRPLDREPLDLVDDLTAAVVATTGKALGVLVRQHGADRLEHRRPGEVLRGDQLELLALAPQLRIAELRDLGVDLGETRGSQIAERALGDAHGYSYAGGA